MKDCIVTGFHAIEERILKAKVSGKKDGLKVFYSKPGPRIKKIISEAKEAGIPVNQAENKILDGMVKSLPASGQDHRGIVLSIEGIDSASQNLVDFDAWLLESKRKADRNHFGFHYRSAQRRRNFA